MSAPHCQELKAKRALDELAIENFIPMRYDIVAKRNGKKSRELVPAIHNLLFVRATRPVVQEAKNRIPVLQYLTCHRDGKNIPIIVPDYQMKQFIAVSNACNEEIVYLKPEEINLKKGTPVRVIGGPFDGIEGVFMRIKGARSRRVVVVIQGIAAAATTEICPDFIEIIHQNR